MKYLYYPDFVECTIHYRTAEYQETWEGFDTFDEAKAEMISYYENLIMDAKHSLKRAKELTE